jgi:hypothetical protein
MKGKKWPEKRGIVSLTSRLMRAESMSVCVYKRGRVKWVEVKK